MNVMTDCTWTLYWEQDDWQKQRRCPALGRGRVEDEWTWLKVSGCGDAVCVVAAVVVGSVLFFPNAANSR